MTTEPSQTANGKCISTRTGSPTSRTSASGRRKDQGKCYPQSELAARDGSRWLAVPHAITPALAAYRKSWFAEVGATESPRTFDEYRHLGAVLKRNGKPFGQTLGHTVNDAPAWPPPFW